jgi:hypothetical protein
MKRIYLLILFVFIVTNTYGKDGFASKISLGLTETPRNNSNLFGMDFSYNEKRLSYQAAYNRRSDGSNYFFTYVLNYSFKYDDSLDFFAYSKYLNDDMSNLKNMDVGIGTGYYLFSNECLKIKPSFALISRNYSIGQGSFSARTALSSRIKGNFSYMGIKYSACVNSVVDEIEYNYFFGYEISRLLLPENEVILDIGLKEDGFIKGGINNFNKMISMAAKINV